MKRRPLEDTLAALRRVGANPDTVESQQELRRVLSSEGSHAVARAAAGGRPELQDALARAFGKGAGP